MASFAISRLAESLLLQDGWYPGRKCEPSQLSLLQRQMAVGGGTPPSAALFDFVQEFGGLMLHRSTAWRLGLARRFVPAIVPGQRVQWVNMMVSIENLVTETNEWMMTEIRKVIGQTYWLGWYTSEAWPLFVDNAFQFHFVDGCTDNVYHIAGSLSSLLEETYRVGHAFSIDGTSVGIVNWSR